MRNLMNNKQDEQQNEGSEEFAPDNLFAEEVRFLGFSARCSSEPRKQIKRNRWRQSLQRALRAKKIHMAKVKHAL